MLKNFVNRLKSSNDKLRGLRKIIKGYDAFLIPTNDQHCSADISRRKFMSGFTGSAGDAIITQDKAYMFVDSRYELQAEKELDLTNWNIIKTSLENGNIFDWCLKNMKAGSVIGFDPSLVPASQIYVYQDKLSKKNIKLKPYPKGNPVDFLMVGASLDMMKLPDEIRDIPQDDLTFEELLEELQAIEGFQEVDGTTDAVASVAASTGQSSTAAPPAPPAPVTLRAAIAASIKKFAKSKTTVPPVLKKIRTHPPDLAGKSTKNKMEELGAKMQEFNADLMVLSVLDEIMWLFNVRASDVAYNQHTPCYAIISRDKSWLFIDGMPDTIRNYLELKNVEILPYESIHKFQFTEKNRCSIWLDLAQLNYKVHQSLHQNHPDARLIDLPSPIKYMKVLKNEGELRGMREAHVLDATALIEFFAWLESQVSSGEATNITEVSIAEKLLEYRQINKDFIQPSFPTIAGVNENGAIVHYQ